MTTHRTHNSTYEVDEKTQRVRRLPGTRSPTAAFGNDGEWREYTSLHRTDFDQLVIIWTNGKGTITSPVLETTP